ncbi:hypothetical protein RsoM2USA_341 [Ralstonia phage RsoM2USA]|nr:hypothetical protein RsoM2USA_341 [Ralstonia phage RsoM2USA]
MILNLHHPGEIMKVTYYQYDWNAGAQVYESHFKIIMNADAEAVRSAWDTDFYTRAASFDHGASDPLVACDAAFQRYQDNPKLRSMAVGDIIKVDTKFYLVKPMGFEKINLD